VNDAEGGDVNDAQADGMSESMSLEKRLFSIGSVAEITGVPEDSLRVWERRYRFPQALRDAAGRRRYIQAEVLRLLWVKMRLDDGIQVGRAIRALHMTDRDSAVSTALREPLAVTKTPEPDTAAARDALLELLLAYDGGGATALLQEMRARRSLEDVTLDVVGPAFAAIGAAWSAGHVTVATEHFATNILRHQLLSWMRASPPPFSVPPIVLACAPEELHEGSLLMLGVLLRQLRWPALYLGQSLPLSDLRVLAEHVKPALIVFVAMSEAPALALSTWPLYVVSEGETRPPIIGYGGQAFIERPELIDLTPGAFLGTTLDEGLRRIHRLMLHFNVLER
jgi:DNA-binding transcriptional MerR regulator